MVRSTSRTGILSITPAAARASARSVALAEDRGLLDLQAHPQPDDDQHGGQQERDPPAPGEERLVALEDGQEGQQAVGDQLAGRGTRLRPRGPEAAVLRVAVLRDDEDRAAPLAAEREALDAAQHRQQHRREYADLGVAGQQPDRERRDAHHQQRDDEQLLAAQLVAEVPEDEAAERPEDEADPVRRERQERRLQWVGGVGEEHVREDGCGRDAVQEEVEPLDVCRRGSRRRCGRWVTFAGCSPAQGWCGT